MNKRQFALSCSLVALVAFAAQPALAQSTAPDPQTTAASTDAAPGTPIGPNGSGLADIVVTAQKVKTDAQKTPLAIQLVGGEAITTQGVDNAKDLNRLVSSLSAQGSGGTGTSFFIRGVGSTNGTANTDNGVAVNLDQVYFSRQYGPDLSFYDLERIEVLKGPQGTLYGRNATGGVINIISNKPELDKFSGYARLEFGNYNEIRSNAAINVPLGPTLAARIAIQTSQHDGYLTDGYDDNFTRGVRAHLLWKPSSNFSLLLTGEYDHQGGKGTEAIAAHGASTRNDTLFANPYVGGGDPQAIAFYNARLLPGPFPGAPASPIPGRPAFYFTAPGSCFPGCVPAGFTSANASPIGQPYHVTNIGYVDVTVKSLRADLEWNLGFANLSIIPALLNTDYSTIFFISPAPFYQAGNARQTSLEIRLASPTNGRFTWLVGAFGQREKQYSDNIYALGFPIPYQRTLAPDVEDHAYGLFAQSSFQIVPTLTLTAGVRYSFERKASFNAIADNTSSLPPFILPAVYLVAPSARESSSSPTFRVGVEWQPAPRNLLYASFATGFHSGGLQQGQPPVRPLCTPNINGTTPQFFASVTGCDAPGTFKPEHLDAYTIGSKNRFFDNHLQLNLELYDWEYTDLQVGVLGLSNPNQTGQVVLNAGTARVRGVDVDALARLTADDEIGISANYNNSKYGALVSYSYILNIPSSLAISNFTGQHFVNAPDFTFTAHYQHIFHLGDSATLTPLITDQYSSPIVFGFTPLIRQSTFDKVDLSLTLRLDNDRFEIQAFGRNVTNIATINGQVGRDSIAQLPFKYLAAPRTFGGSVRVNF